MTDPTEVNPTGRRITLIAGNPYDRSWLLAAFAAQGPERVMEMVDVDYGPLEERVLLHAADYDMSGLVLDLDMSGIKRKVEVLSSRGREHQIKYLEPQTRAVRRADHRHRKQFKMKGLRP